VIGVLPLGGVFAGSLENYQRAVGIDNFEIQLHIMHNMAVAPPAAVAGAIMRMQGQSDARIMAATDALVLLQAMLGAAIKPSMEKNNRPGPLPKPRTPPAAASAPPPEEPVEPRGPRETDPVHLAPPIGR
jgi:hypothetical protein